MFHCLKFKFFYNKRTLLFSIVFKLVEISQITPKPKEIRSCFNAHKTLFLLDIISLYLNAGCTSFKEEKRKFPSNFCIALLESPPGASSHTVNCTNIENEYSVCTSKQHQLFPFWFHISILRILISNEPPRIKIKLGINFESILWKNLSKCRFQLIKKWCFVFRCNLFLSRLLPSFFGRSN